MSGPQKIDFEPIDFEPIGVDFEPQQAGAEPRYGLGETVLEKGAKGASFGLLPAMQAGAEIATPSKNPEEGWMEYLGRLGGSIATAPGKLALSSASKLFGGGGLPAVEASRQQWLGRGEQMQAERPAVSLASELVGGALVPGGAGAKTFGQALKSGMALGAGQALGTSLGEGDAAKEMALKTAIGAGGGLVGGAAGKYVPQAIGAAKGLPGALRDFAELRAVKALNPQLKNLRGMDEQAIKDLGRELLDRKMVTFGDSSAEVTKRLAGEVERSGGAVGEALDAAEAAAAGGSPVNLGNVQFNLGQEASGISPLRPDLRGAYQSQAEVLADAPQRMGIREGEMAKRALQEQVNYAVPTNEQKASNQALEQAAKYLRGEVERGIGEVGEQTGNPNLLGNFLTAKQRYAPMQQALDIAEAGSLRDFRNRWVSPSDYGAGLGQFVRSGQGEAAPSALGGSLTGAAAALAHKAMRQRGSASLAKGADVAANELGLLGQSLGVAEPLAEYAGQAMGPGFSRAGGALSQYFGMGDQPVQASTEEEAQADLVQRMRVKGGQP